MKQKEGALLTRTKRCLSTAWILRAYNTFNGMKKIWAAIWFLQMPPTTRDSFSLGFTNCAQSCERGSAKKADCARTLWSGNKRSRKKVTENTNLTQNGAVGPNNPNPQIRAKIAINMAERFSTRNLRPKENFPPVVPKENFPRTFLPHRTVQNLCHRYLSNRSARRCIKSLFKNGSETVLPKE